MSDPRQTEKRGTARSRKNVLFLAQTPPPHHGQATIAALVRDVLETDADMIVDQRWRGGAQSNRDVGKKSIGKYFGFAGLLIELFFLFIIGRRYDFAYLGIAPWAHTAMRDALLAGLAKRLSKRTWIHVHGNGLTELIEKPGATGFLARWLLSGTEVIAITDDACRKASASGLFARVLPLANMSADPGDPVERTQDVLTIACLGNLDPRKGVLDFVDVVSAVARHDTGVQAVIIGGETAQLGVDDVKARAASLGAGGKIQVTGWVTEERKTALLANADVFLYLSRHDLAPVALIEALAHGCAPIVLDIGGLAEMVGPELSSNVISHANASTALVCAEAMIRNYRLDKAALSRDKARGRERYLKTYSPQIFRKTILEFLGVAADRTPRRTPRRAEPSPTMMTGQAQ